MSNSITYVINWLLTHLVASVFVIFIGIAFIWRGPLLGLGDSVEEERKASSEVVAISQSGGGKVELESPAADGASDRSVSSSPVGGDTEEKVFSGVVFRPADSGSVSEVVKSPVSPEQPAGENSGLNPGPHGELLNESQLLELLHEARAAFWEGSKEKAESLYLRYLEQRPEDANGFGELGNLLQSMGRKSQALDAYYEAGIRFRLLGDLSQLKQIVELLDDNGDPRAAQLRK